LSFLLETTKLARSSIHSRKELPPEAAVEILNGHGPDSLFVECTEYRALARLGSTSRSSDTYCMPRSIANSSPYVSTRGIDSLRPPKIRPRCEQRPYSLRSCVVENQRDKAAEMRLSAYFFECGFVQGSLRLGKHSPHHRFEEF
jgi:hypothetical protein